MGALGLYGIVLLRTSWVCDDAFITLRTVDNFVRGFGLTWNIGERVQAYTHPLWMFLLSGAYALTREPLLTTILLSIVVSLVGLLIYALVQTPRIQVAAIGILALSLSKFFVDYSTSGLENPLTHLILIGFYTVFFLSRSDMRTLFFLALIAALGALNRMDTILLTAPALGFAFWRIRSGQAVLAIASGFVPLVAWEAFSIFYYGSLVPNTALAKLNTGVAKIAILAQGAHYFEAALRGDRLLIAIIVCALIVGFISKVRAYRAMATGIVLYLLYIVYIGGCFMAGRYFTAPLVVSVMLLSQYGSKLKDRWLLVVAGVIVVIGLTSSYSPLYSGRDYGSEENKRAFGYGIDDERLLYFQESGLFTLRGFQPVPMHTWALEGFIRRLKGPGVFTWGGIGFVGYYGGPDLHIIDFYGLADPLLARLPGLYDINWKIGHFIRQLPEGYFETISGHTDKIRDEYLARYYDTLSFVISGPLYDYRRIAAALKMGFGSYDNLLAEARPILLAVSQSDYSIPRSEGIPWWWKENLSIPSAGVRVCLDSTSHAGQIEISLDNNDDYILRFFRGGEDIAEARVKAAGRPEVGLAVYREAVPSAAVKAGFDEIRVVPVKNDGEYALGHLILR